MHVFLTSAIFPGLWKHVHWPRVEPHITQARAIAVPVPTRGPPLPPFPLPHQIVILLRRRSLPSPADGERREMSMSSSASPSSWPRYGSLPMTRCPDCPRIAPLKRLTTISEKNGNHGREFVKCESKPEAGKVKSMFCCVFLLWILTPDLFIFPRNWYLGFPFPFSEPENMQAFWVAGWIRWEASNGWLNWFEARGNPRGRSAIGGG